MPECLFRSDRRPGRWLKLLRQLLQVRCDRWINPKSLLKIVRDGDLIEIDIPARTINLLLSDPDIAARLAAQKNFEPAGRKRTVPKSLQAYARFVSSADQGAVRIL